MGCNVLQRQILAVAVKGDDAATVKSVWLRRCIRDTAKRYARMTNERVSANRGEDRHDDEWLLR